MVAAPMKQYVGARKRKPRKRKKTIAYGDRKPGKRDLGYHKARSNTLIG